jgi:hypothetical protein
MKTDAALIAAAVFIKGTRKNIFIAFGGLSSFS